VKIYVEGGGDSKQLKIECRKGFSKLIEKAGFAGRMPTIVACGGRSATRDKFLTALKSKQDLSIMLVDSEDPVTEASPWDHLRFRDKWERPSGVIDEQVQLMITSMESWLVADRSALEEEFGRCLQVTALPSLSNLEARGRQEVLQALENATRQCGHRNSYSKGARSFKILARLDPAVMKKHLPSFVRFIEVLDKHL
jgi:hypothetical protein